MDDDPKFATSKSKPKSDLEDQYGLDCDEVRAKVVFIRQDNEGVAMDGIKRIRATVLNRARRLLCCHLIWDHRGPRRRRRPSKKKIDEVTPDDHLNHHHHRIPVTEMDEKMEDVVEPIEDQDGDFDYADDEEDWEMTKQKRHKRQYRLASAFKHHTTWRSWLKSILCCCGLVGRATNESVGMVPGTTRGMLRFLHWMFRVNVLLLFFFMCFMFFAICVFFAALIVLAGDIEPNCVRIGTEPLSTFSSRFFNAFFLSWTTFSTVGYGAVSPAVSNEFTNTNASRCLFITTICSLDAFAGILYTGFCGAVLFSKVLRVQHHAQVVFSDPIIIQFGAGVEEYDDPEGVNEEIDYSDNKSNELTLDSIIEAVSKPQKMIPLPVLEFRIVNKLCGEPCGEIIDAKLNVVANIDADDVDPSLRNALDPAMQLRRALATMSATRSLQSTSRPRSREHSWGSAFQQSSSRPRSRQHSWSTSEEQTATSDSRSDYDNFFSAGASELANTSFGRNRQRQLSWGSSGQLAKFFDPFGSLHPLPPITSDGRNRLGDLNEHHSVDEDPTSKFVTKRILSKMHLEASEHPFFKRVWLARHVLDENSPLLKPKVRRHIRRNGRFWPERLNSHEGVRQSLKFNQIMVSLKGVSNISAANVFAQKIYDYVDLSVGYRFQNLFFRDSEGHIQLDKDLINDVVEQKGGGGEPLISNV